MGRGVRDAFRATPGKPAQAPPRFPGGWRANLAAGVGSARRLPGAGTLVAVDVSNGLSGSTGTVEVYEVAPDGRGVRHLVVLGAWIIYRDEQIASHAGEEPAAP